MKLEKPFEVQTWSLKDVSMAYGIPITTLSNRCRSNGLKPKTNNGNLEYCLTAYEVEIITDYEKFPEVIYVSRVTEIYPSKLNYLTLNQL